MDEGITKECVMLNPQSCLIRSSEKTRCTSGEKHNQCRLGLCQEFDETMYKYVTKRDWEDAENMKGCINGYEMGVPLGILCGWKVDEAITSKNEYAPMRSDGTPLVIPPKYLRTGRRRRDLWRANACKLHAAHVQMDLRKVMVCENLENIRMLREAMGNPNKLPKELDKVKKYCTVRRTVKLLGIKKKGSIMAWAYNDAAIPQNSLHCDSATMIPGANSGDKCDAAQTAIWTKACKHVVDSLAKFSVGAALCWSDRLNGKYIQEQHGQTNECYDFQTAKQKCEESVDCHGIATQSNTCGGKYRVTHGSTATDRKSVV